MVCYDIICTCLAHISIDAVLTYTHRHADVHASMGTKGRLHMYRDTYRCTQAEMDADVHTDAEMDRYAGRASPAASSSASPRGTAWSWAPSTSTRIPLYYIILYYVMSYDSVLYHSHV